MKNLFLISFLLFICTSSVVLAQQQEYGGQHNGNGQQGNWTPPPPADRAKNFVSKMSEKVEMTQQQKDSLQLVFTKFFMDIQTYKVADNPGVFDQLKMKRDSSVKRILVDDSKYGAYQNFMASMKQHAQGNGNQGNWHQTQKDGSQDPNMNNPH